MWKRVLIIIFFLFLYTNIKSYSQGCLTVDMVILIDWSGSEEGNEIKLITAASMFVSNLTISEYQVRVGILTFSDVVTNRVNLTGNKDELLNNIIQLGQTKAEGSTYIEDATSLAMDQLINKRDVPKIMIIISDGDIYDIMSGVKIIQESKKYIPLSVYAVQIGGNEYDKVKLVLLTDNEQNVEYAAPFGLVEALKRLNLCN